MARQSRLLAVARDKPLSFPEIQFHAPAWSDFGKLARIDAGSYENPWNSDRFQERSNSISIGVCVYQKRVVGYLAISQTEVGRVHRMVKINRFAIDPDYRRLRFGMRIMVKLAEILQPQMREIYTNVHETNVTGQLFLRSLGYRTTGSFDRTPEQGDREYRFTKSLAGKPERCEEGTYS